MDVVWLTQSNRVCLQRLDFWKFVHNNFVVIPNTIYPETNKISIYSLSQISLRGWVHCVLYMINNHIHIVCKTSTIKKIKCVLFKLKTIDLLLVYA